MGLIQPLSGKITIDGVELGPDTASLWHRQVAHVPQVIFLSDDSIARNIALATVDDAMDMPRVERASSIAQIHEFIDSLPDGYDARVGERGVRLSGGQRQRLGLARAVYKEAPVLVLDEATSALDDDTERAVLGALDALGRDGCTIIIVAHRASTIASCDMVVRLEGGQIVTQSINEVAPPKSKDQPGP
jgi:ATP-binding cassette subfamily B protein